MKVFYSYIRTRHLDQHEKNTLFIKSYLLNISGIKLIENEILKTDFSIKEDKNILKDLSSSDVFIGEMSRASQTQGFLLGQSINQGKPSLYLYDEMSLGKPRNVLMQYPSRLMVIKSYNISEVGSKINKFLKSASRQLLSDRITFVCSKKIRNHIDSESKKYGISKGELIRSIIEKEMNNLCD